MVKQAVSSVLYRVLLPLVLLTAVVFRYNVLSFIYLLLMLLNPLLPGPLPENIRSGHPKRYLITILSTSIIFCIAHIVFQAVLLIGPEHYAKDFDYCKSPGRIFALFGFHNLDNANALDAIRLIGLDFLVLFVSFGVFVTCSKLEPPEETVEANTDLDQSDMSRVIRRKKKRRFEILYWTGEILVLVFLAAAGILYPSLSSAVYFLIFLTVCTWFACNRKIGRKYLLCKVPLAIFSVLHFIVLYLYQLDYAQEYVLPESLLARLIGLIDLIKVDCNTARTLEFVQNHWNLFVSPLMILSLYWVLALIIYDNLIAPMKTDITSEEQPPHTARIDSMQSSRRSGTSVRRRRQSKAGAKGDDRIRLLDDDRMGRTYQSTASVSCDSDAKETLAVDPNGSVIWTSESDVPEKTAEGHDTPTIPASHFKVRKVLYPIISAIKLIAKGSYVATLIIMMTWSITYHSWLTFVLLLWSCILWMCPNSRQACLKTSPALVAYAEALIVLEYILGLKLNANEIPEFKPSIIQIGLYKYGDLTYQSLFIKILYTMMFWITLRQYIEEKQEARRRDISEGVMLEPFNISYCTAQPGFPRPSLRRHFSIVPSMASPNPYIRVLAEVTYNLLVKYWIWVVAIMLMVISLGGDVVVVYRIVYMFLFLFFILMFQFSYHFWRKIMYGFWLTVIIFSMLVLILIYTYQFDGFKDYWREYLKVSDTMQQDLGLELYDSDTGKLFFRLLTPTFFLIITIIQLHYFHKEFLIISDLNYKSYECVADQTSLLVTASTGAQNESPQTHITIDQEAEIHGDGAAIRPAGDRSVSVVQSPATPQKDDMDSTRAEREFKAVKECLENMFLKISVIFSYISEFTWRFLEIHIIKITLFSVFCLSAYDVCAIHFVYIGFVVVALRLRSLQSFFSHCCSVWTATLLLSKMIYQLNIAGNFNWEVNCTAVIGLNSTKFPYPFNETIDSRIWIGYKTTQYLADYCKGYIGLFLVLTIQAVVKIRQKVNRLNLNEPEPKPGILFPNSTRDTADKNVLECFKYLANYFFYKFGLEVCFITIVVCIAVRLDVFGTLTAVCLCILFLLRRKTLAKIWSIYVAYQCIVLPIQYIMCIGLPPGMCREYPWIGDILPENLREWLFLPDYTVQPNARKLVADFFQLLFACCQLFVFKIETSPLADEYEGGSNRELRYEERESSSFHPTPIHDFISYTESALDIIKVLFFSSCFWITLAVVFEAGRTRVNVFAMGYLVGCFYFLSSGNEFYLKSKRKLLNIWNILIAYNVIVIMIKIILHLIGCVYLVTLKKNSCWVVQLFGIACLKNSEAPVDGGTFDKDTFDKNSFDEGTFEEDTISCKSDDNDAGIFMDGICFAFAIMQKRVFSCCYFQHLVNEVEAQHILFSRGTELIHEIQMKEVQEQQLAEKEIMKKIKKNMDRILAYQEKIRGSEIVEPTHHFQAIRSGDYYMFDDYLDGDMDLELSSKYKRNDSDNEEVKEKGINALLSKTLRKSLRTVDEHQKDPSESEDIGSSGQQSPIVSTDASPISSTSENPPLKSPDSPSNSSPQIQSTSSQKDDETTLQEAKLEDQEPKEEVCTEKVKRWWDFFCEFVNSILISCTAKLNAVSRDYRFVAKHLATEKKLLKEKYTRNGYFSVIEAENDMIRNQILERGHSSSKDSKQLCVISCKNSSDCVISGERKLSAEAFNAERKKKHSIFTKFLTACYYAAISRTELLCYIVIIINQMETATILSLPLPLFVFLWGTLSVPRPSRAFWITIIIYTEAIVVLKYFFQFYFYKWNQSIPPLNDPFYPPLIFGIRKNENYAAYDLIVLMAVFFHRLMLKSLGLWKHTHHFAKSQDLSVAKIPDTNYSQIYEKSLITPTVPTITKAKDTATTEKDIITDASDNKDDRNYNEGGKNDKEDGDEKYDEISIALEEVNINIREYINKIISPFKKFFFSFLYQKYFTDDVYAFMFFCDFINFFIVVFGYSSFGTGDEGVTSYFEENRVPVPFLIMLVAQFALIVTDRALYLRKYILGKFMFQIFLIFLVHMWMFFMLPAITLRQFTASSNLPPKMWYFIKCVYLLLSAYQIRSGYPTRILGNFLCKKYNYANYILFQIYMSIPFLYELRCFMDWIWTDTSLNISNWLKMENIYSNIFLLKCYRRAEEDYPIPRGTKMTALIKYGIGGSLLFAIIIVIWSPLVVFALGSTVGRSNIPMRCTVELGISGFEPLFRMTALQNQIRSFTYEQFHQLQVAVESFNNPSITNFLAGFNKEDTTIVELSGESTSIWAISPPSRLALINELRGDNHLELYLSWSFTRSMTAKDNGNEVRDRRVIDLTEEKYAELRNNLANMMSNNLTHPVKLENIFPNYMKVPVKGKPTVVGQFYPSPSSSGDEKTINAFFGVSPYRALNTTMNLLDPNDINTTKWWIVKDICTPNKKPYNIPGINDCNFLRMVVFSNKAFPKELSIASRYGIIGLYTTFVLLVWRIVHSFVVGSPFQIMFVDMPYVDRVLQLCLDIYLVRESSELTLEEDLFAKLIFLHRSPETLIKWTRRPDQELKENLKLSLLTSLR